MVEQPTVTEPSVDLKPTNESASSDILAKLKELEIDNPKKLENMSIASSQAGKLANDLGTTREELRRVSEELARITQNSSNPYNLEQEIDVGSVVRKETKQAIAEYMKEYNDNQTRATEAYYHDMGDIQGDRRYGVLRKPFEEHMQSLEIQNKVRTGQTTITKEYSKIKDAYLDILEENLSNVGKVRSPAPHVETGETHTVPMPTMDEEKRGKIKNRIDPVKGWSGTDENIIGLVRDMMAGDSIFK